MKPISLIVAMSKNRVIGKNNSIPWRLPAELNLFKSITIGHHIIMGRRTFESINRLLPGRSTVIVTRNPDYSFPGALVAHSLEDALSISSHDPETFVIGGAELFALALPLASKLYLTVVQADIPGDTYMPEINLSDWKMIESQHFKADEKNLYDFNFYVYTRTH